MQIKEFLKEFSKTNQVEIKNILKQSCKKKPAKKEQNICEEIDKAIAIAKRLENENNKIVKKYGQVKK